MIFVPSLSVGPEQEILKCQRKPICKDGAGNWALPGSIKGVGKPGSSRKVILGGMEFTSIWSRRC